MWRADRCFGKCHVHEAGIGSNVSRHTYQTCNTGIQKGRIAKLRLTGTAKSVYDRQSNRQVQQAQGCNYQPKVRLPGKIGSSISCMESRRLIEPMLLHLPRACFAIEVPDRCITGAGLAGDSLVNS